jgi:hypothetical protein
VVGTTTVSSWELGVAIASLGFVFSTAICSSCRTTLQQLLSVSLWRNEMVKENMNEYE